MAPELGLHWKENQYVSPNTKIQRLLKLLFDLLRKVFESLGTNWTNRITWEECLEPNHTHYSPPPSPGVCVRACTHARTHAHTQDARLRETSVSVQGSGGTQAGGEDHSPCPGSLGKELLLFKPAASNHPKKVFSQIGFSK